MGGGSRVGSHWTKPLPALLNSMPNPGTIGAYIVVTACYIIQLPFIKLPITEFKMLMLFLTFSEKNPKKVYMLLLDWLGCYNCHRSK